MTGKVVNLKSLRNSILVWDIHGEPTVESYELSEVLGYAQYGSLRKQILTDWKEIMQAGDDYILVHDSVPIRQYEAFWDQSHRSGATNKPARTPVLPKRGYLFITGAGLQKILERTTKENAKAFSDETALIFHELDSEYEFVAPDDLSVDISTVQPSPPKPAPAPSVPEISQEDRRFQYDVLQTLLKQLQEFDDVAMKEIAIAAAEAATGKDFSYLRPNRPSLRPAPSRFLPRCPRHPARGRCSRRRGFTRSRRLVTKPEGTHRPPQARRQTSSPSGWGTAHKTFARSS
jgi:hypothetical protein